MFSSSVHTKGYTAIYPANDTMLYSHCKSLVFSLPNGGCYQVCNGTFPTRFNYTGVVAEYTELILNNTLYDFDCETGKKIRVEIICDHYGDLFETLVLLEEHSCMFPCYESQNETILTSCSNITSQCTIQPAIGHIIQDLQPIYNCPVLYDGLIVSRINCAYPLSIPHMQFDCPSTIKFMDICHLNCSKGFFLQGPSVAQCNSLGTVDVWSSCPVYRCAQYPEPLTVYETFQVNNMCVSASNDDECFKICDDDKGGVPNPFLESIPMSWICFDTEWIETGYGPPCTEPYCEIQQPLTVFEPLLSCPSYLSDGVVSNAVVCEQSCGEGFYGTGLGMSECFEGSMTPNPGALCLPTSCSTSLECNGLPCKGGYCCNEECGDCMTCTSTGKCEKGTGYSVSSCLTKDCNSLPLGWVDNNGQPVVDFNKTDAATCLLFYGCVLLGI